MVGALAHDIVASQRLLAISHPLACRPPRPTGGHYVYHDENGNAQAPLDGHFPLVGKADLWLQEGRQDCQEGQRVGGSLTGGKTFPFA